MLVSRSVFLSLVDVAETLSEIIDKEFIYKQMQGKNTEIKMKSGEISRQAKENVCIWFL